MKQWWKSLTIWTAVLFAASTAFDTHIQTFITEHPKIAGPLVSFVMILLRFWTTKALFAKKTPCPHPECPNA